MEKSIAVGATVALKSAPNEWMTVEDLADSKTDSGEKCAKALCLWRDGNEMHRAWMRIETLMRVGSVVASAYDGDGCDDCADMADRLAQEVQRGKLSSFEREIMESLRNAEETRGKACSADVVQVLTNVIDRLS